MSTLSLTKRQYLFSYPFAPSEVVEFFRLYYGPTNRAFASLDAEGQADLRKDLEALWTAHNQAGPDCTTVYGEYLEVIGIRA